jgi:hypothetical protein
VVNDYIYFVNEEKIEEKIEEMYKVKIECIWVEHVKVVNDYIYFVNEEKIRSKCTKWE